MFLLVEQIFFFWSQGEMLLSVMMLYHFAALANLSGTRSDYSRLVTQCGRVMVKCSAEISKPYETISCQFAKMLARKSPVYRAMFIVPLAYRALLTLGMKLIDWEKTSLAMMKRQATSPTERPSCECVGGTCSGSLARTERTSRGRARLRCCGYL